MVSVTANLQGPFSSYSSHSVCDTCSLLERYSRSCSTKEEFEFVRGLKYLHREKYGKTRIAIEILTRYSETYPEEYITIFVDGMDNSKSYCPRLQETMKSMAGFFHLPTKITGVIICSSKYPQKRKIMFFVNHDNFAQDSNMVVTIIHKTLTEIVSDHGRLPPNLHISVDNCWRLYHLISIF